MQIRTFSLRMAMLAGFALVSCQTPASAPRPALPPEYAALPDTFVCVVDRSTARGLAEIPAKVAADGIVVLTDDRILPLAEAHPTTMIAGYAGREGWLTRNEPVELDGRRYLRTGGERRVPLDLLVRAGEFQGILLFAGLEDAPPVDALYVPTAPGCIFQAYVREDLMRR